MRYILDGIDRARDGYVGVVRRLAGVAIVALIAVGVLFVIGTAVVHAAWALPWHEFPARPGVLAGVGVAVGGVLLATNHPEKTGSLAPRAPEVHPLIGIGSAGVGGSF